MTVKRGEIYYADLSPVVGSEQGGVRPVLIVQNDVGNRYSPTVIAAAITSQKEKSKLPTHIEINSQVCGLSRDSVVLLEQIRTLDKKRLKEKMGRLDDGSMGQINQVRIGREYWTEPVYITMQTGFEGVVEQAPAGFTAGACCISEGWPSSVIDR